MFPAGFVRVYRESRLLRALEFLFLPLELLVALGGGIVFVSVPVAVLAGVQEVGALEALATMAVAESSRGGAAARRTACWST